jgi:hypothetical protein
MFLPFNFFINDNTGTHFYIWTINVFLIVVFYTYLAVVIWRGGTKRI